MCALIPPPPPQNIGDTKLEELLPSIEPLTAKVKAVLLHRFRAY